MPEVIEGIPGTFVDPDTKHLRWVRNQPHETILTRKLPKFAMLTPHRIYYADTPDGCLRCMTSQDPAEHGGAWRMSMLHYAHDGSHVRLPTWDELKHARYTLIGRDIHMCLVLPGQLRGLPNDGYVDEYQWILQAVQVRAEHFQ